MSTGDDTDKLINSLCEGHHKVRCLMPPHVRAVLYFILTAAYVFGLVFSHGLRMDWQERLTDIFFMTDMALAAAIWISALCAVAWLCIPDMRGQGWIKILPVGLTSVLILVEIGRGGMEGMNFSFSHGTCFEGGLLMGMVPLALVAFMSRGGNTTSPYWMAGMNALAVGAAGYIGLRLLCPMDDVGHGFIMHFLPFILIGAAVALLARKLFRW